MIILALFLFKYSAALYNAIIQTTEYNRLIKELYYLLFLKALLSAIPFFVFFILAVIEFDKITKQIKNKKIK